MPPRRPQPVGRLLLAGGLAIALSVGMVAAVVRAASRNPEQFSLGAQEFVVGKHRAFAPVVDRDGPLLFKDPLNRGRDLFLSHLTGRHWVAFEARQPGRPPRCAIVIDRRRRVLVDPCTKRVVPDDGPGLTHYKVRIDEEDRVVVNLRQRLQSPPP